MNIRRGIVKSLLAAMLWVGIVIGMGSGAYGAGIDLGAKGNNYGIVSQISMETGRIFTGRMFVVDSGHTLARDVASSGNFKSPYATIDYAIGRAGTPNATGPNNGNLILIQPGHTETVTAAAGVAVDIAGLTFAGVGLGSDRPTVNFTTVVGADLDVDAANTTFYNILFTGGIDALTGPLDINAADCSFIKCEYRDVTGQATDVMVCDENADRLLIDGYIHRGAAADGADSAILFANGSAATDTVDDIIARNFNIYGNFDTGCIENTGSAMLRCNIGGGTGWNFLWSEGSEDILIAAVGTSTGFIGPNIAARLADDASNITEAYPTSTAFQFMQNLPIVNGDGETSINFNGTASTD